MTKEEPSYTFRDDDGAYHEVSFEEMMEAKDGFLTRPNGEVWRRVFPATKRAGRKPKEFVKIVSDALGVGPDQLDEARQHLQETGIKGIEFVADDSDGDFYHVEASSQKAMDRYTKSRDMVNKTKRSAAVLSPRDFENAKELLLRS